MWMVLCVRDVMYDKLGTLFRASEMLTAEPRLTLTPRSSHEVDVPGSVYLGFGAARLHKPLQPKTDLNVLQVNSSSHCLEIYHVAMFLCVKCFCVVELVSYNYTG